MKFEFREIAKVGLARAGEIATPHGSIKTPVFMPVGTRGSVKSLSPDDLDLAGAEIVLGNTYHLYLKPGQKIIKNQGGLHNFMKWRKPILTDSGGFQVSSLGNFRDERSQNFKQVVKNSKVDDDGVTFWSHYDGSEHRITAEKSIEIQEALGADIIIAFDEATPNRGREYAQKAMTRTHLWLDRSIERWKRLESDKPEGILPQALFGVVQGGVYPDLRKESAEYVVSKNLPGIAIGGGEIGVDWQRTEEQLSWFRHLLPKDKPVYLMGVGVRPEEVVGAMVSGADMFDCVAPTRWARMGLLYTGAVFLSDSIPWQYDYSYRVDFPGELKLSYVSQELKGKLSIGNKKYESDSTPIEKGCDCYTCSYGFSRAYLRHLFQLGELLYFRLATIHNLRKMVTTTKTVRDFLVEKAGK